MKSLYYLARIKHIVGDNSTAMSSVMKCHEIAKKLNDQFWQARAADVISLVLSRSYYYEESIEYSKEAAKLYKNNGYDGFYLYTMGDLAARYNSLGQYDKCETILDSLQPKIEAFPTLKIYLLGIGHLMYEKKGEYTKAEEYGDTLLKYKDILEYPSTDLADIAFVKIAVGKLKEAKSLLTFSADKMESVNDSIFYYDAMVQLSKKEGNLAQAFEYQEILSKLDNKIFKNAVKQSAVAGQRNFYSAEAANTEKIAQRNKLLFIFSTIIGLLLIMIGTLLYHIRLNRKNTAISKQMTEIILLSKKIQEIDFEKESLSKKLAKHGEDIANLSTILSNKNNEIQLLAADLTQNKGQNELLSKKIQPLLQGRFSQLNIIINEYAAQEENETNYLAFYKNIKHEIDKFKRPENIQEIERMVDDCLDGIISKIRTQIPTMREKDITLISLTLAGLNARAIGLFLGIHPNYTYRRKKQLIKIIADSNASDAPEIVEILSRY
ncbi:hypothetical protein [uncultured Duncaniella sp.]|uniref:hypothetical protein n=2 Tax=uncultured Duncaniella sp. TaxID=2768039 RepID=UPI00262DB35D|nr:hypothetical protein [uncultured Duncaniella sp.]